jgi:predicted transcriptional regulator
MHNAIATIVVGYMQHMSLEIQDICDLVEALNKSFSKEPNDDTTVAIHPKTPKEIKNSIQDDALISFEDGRHYKTLKRHLTIRGLTPITYREKHGLPVDYPMVCPSYSAHRSELAKTMGLGHVKDKRRSTSVLR